MLMLCTFLGGRKSLKTEAVHVALLGCIHYTPQICVIHSTLFWCRTCNAITSSAVYVCAALDLNT
jgi:hypothetical protein